MAVRLTLRRSLWLRRGLTSSASTEKGMRKAAVGIPDSARCFAATRGWLAYVDPKDDCPVYLANPYTSDGPRLVRPPPLLTMPSVLDVQRDPLTDNILNFITHTDFHYPNEFSMDSCRSVENQKLLAGGICAVAMSQNDPNDKDCVVTALYRGELARLSYSRLSGDSNANSNNLEWIGLQEQYNPCLLSNTLVYSDVTNLFFVLDLYPRHPKDRSDI